MKYDLEFFDQECGRLTSAENPFAAHHGFWATAYGGWKSHDFAADAVGWRRALLRAFTT
jgi:hypothetical protein